MKPNVIDLTGQRFGCLVVLGFSHSRNGAYWNCICDCGSPTVVRGGVLRYGTVKSCGCGSRDQARKNCQGWWSRNSHIPEAIRGKLKDCYGNMWRRCNHPSDNRWESYGGRGISVCEEWSGPEGRQSFYRWAMQNGYEPRLTLDRIDVDGDYCPENCRFADLLVQMNNTTRNRFLEWNGERKTIAQWARTLGLSYMTVYKRNASGWSMDEIANNRREGRRV